MKLTYKKVTLENIEIAFDIQKMLWPNDQDYNNFKNKALYSKDDDVSFIVYLENNPVGITGVYTEDIDNESIWLDWYGVLPKYRNQGIGKQILLDTIEYCKKLMQYDYLRLDTTYYPGRPAIYLYDSIMTFKEKYTIEDVDKKHNYMIYTYSLHGKKKYWNNRYLGLTKYYEDLKKNKKQ